MGLVRECYICEANIFFRNSLRTSIVHLKQRYLKLRRRLTRKLTSVFYTTRGLETKVSRMVDCYNCTVVIFFQSTYNTPRII